MRKRERKSGEGECGGMREGEWGERVGKREREWGESEESGVRERDGDSVWGERGRERVVRKSEKMGVGERREREIRKRPEMVKREEYEGEQEVIEQ